jgi:hypothetical protein
VGFLELIRGYLMRKFQFLNQIAGGNRARMNLQRSIGDRFFAPTGLWRVLALDHATLGSWRHARG